MCSCSAICPCPGFRVQVVNQSNSMPAARSLSAIGGLLGASSLHLRGSGGAHNLGNVAGTAGDRSAANAEASLTPTNHRELVWKPLQEQTWKMPAPRALQALFPGTTSIPTCVATAWRELRDSTQSTQSGPEETWFTQGAGSTN